MAPKKRRRPAPAAKTPLQQAQARNLRARHKPASPWWPVLGTLAALAVIIGIFFGIRWYQAGVPTTPTASPSTAASPNATAQVLAILNNLPAASTYAVKLGSAQDTLTHVSGSPLTDGSKVVVLYVGAEYCPYCAAERWPLVIALSRFGTFSKLTLTTSSSTDAYPETATFSFRTAAYSSPYVSLQAVETADRSQRPLQSPTAAQQALLGQYDPKGGIPFVDFGNLLTLAGATYSPGDLANLDALAIANALQQPSSKQAQDILGSANLITVAICHATVGAPASVCNQPDILALAKSLPQ